VTQSALAVIPARYASERFPGKPLALIDGVPMIVRVLQNVARSDSVDRVVVATDDERIAAAVRDAGGEVTMTPASLPSGSDRVWAAASDQPHDIVVNVQGDEPLVPGSLVDALVERLRSEASYDIATPVVAVPRTDAVSPDVVTVACDDAGTALYFSRSVIPFGGESVWRHIGVYAYRKRALERYVQSAPTALESREKLEQLRALSLGLRIAAVEVDVVTQAVDRPEDVGLVERVLAGSSGAVRDVGLVVLDVDGVLTDGRIQYLGDEAQLVDFDVKDGYGIVALLASGIDVALLSSRDSPALRRRAAELGIKHVRAGVTDKPRELERLCRDLEVDLARVCVAGDDDPDVAVMAMAGLSAAPGDASPRAQAQATIVLRSHGGRGAVRELADLLISGMSGSARGA
jgi:3-deoxy-D-manno-octulosonate 8-phosphate phosphatase (KDO 8-P phosphatase)